MSEYNLGRVVGYSAYELAEIDGYEGTEAEWLESLRLHLDDLTDEEIAVLQEPATTVAESAAAAEALRVIAEEEREEAEADRVELYETVDAKITGKLNVADIAQGLGSSQVVPISQSEATKHIASYNVSNLYPTSGIDDSAYYDLDTAVSVLSTNLDSSQKAVGVKLLFTISTNDGTYQEEYIFNSNLIYFANSAYWSYNKAMYNVSKDGTQYESLADALSSTPHNLRSNDIVTFVNSQTGYQEGYMYKHSVKTGTNYKLADNYERILCERDYNTLAVTDESLQSLVEATTSRLNSYNLADISELKSDTHINSSTGEEYTYSGATTLYIPLNANSDTVIYVLGCNYSKGVLCFNSSTYLGYVDSASKTVIDNDYYHWSVTGFPEGTTRIALAGSPTLNDTVAVYLKDESTYYEYGVSYEDILADSIPDLDIVQETGASEISVMSQKSVTVLTESLESADEFMQGMIDATTYRLDSYNLADISELKSNTQINSTTGEEYSYDGATTLHIPLYANPDTVIYVLDCNYNKGLHCFNGSTYLGYVDSTSKTMIDNDAYHWSVTGFPEGTTRIALAGSPTLNNTVAVYLKDESTYYEYGLSYEDILANSIPDLDIVQNTGASEVSIMSQKSVTELSESLQSVMFDMADATSNRLDSYNLADISGLKSDTQINTTTGEEYSYDGSTTLYIPLYANPDTVIYILDCNYSKGLLCFNGSTYLGYIDSTSKTVIDDDYYHWSATGFPEGTTRIALAGSASLNDTVAVYLKDESTYYEYGVSYEDILSSFTDKIIDVESINNVAEYNAFLRQDEIFVRPNLIDSSKCDSETLLSDYIYVSPGKTYYLYGTYYLGSSNVRFHDIDKNLLSDGGVYDSDAGTITVSSDDCVFIQFKFVAAQHITSCILCEEGYRGQVLNCNYRWIPRRSIFNPFPAVEVWGDSQAARPYHAGLTDELGLDSVDAIKHYSYGGMTTSAIREKFLQAGEHNLPVVFLGMTNDDSIDIETSIENNRLMIESLGHENYIVCSRFSGAWNEADSTATTNTERLASAKKYDERLESIYGMHYLNLRELFIGMGYNFHQVRLMESFVQPAVGESVTVQLSDGGVSKIAYRTINSDGTAATWTSRNIMIGFGGLYDTYSISSYDTDADTLTLTLVEANYKQPEASVANIEYTEATDSGGTLHTYTDYLMVFCEGDKDQIDAQMYPNTIYYDSIHLNDVGGEIVGRAIGRRLKLICK